MQSHAKALAVTETEWDGNTSSAHPEDQDACKNNLKDKDRPKLWTTSAGSHTLIPPPMMICIRHLTS